MIDSLNKRVEGLNEKIGELQKEIHDAEQNIKEEYQKTKSYRDKAEELEGKQQQLLERIEQLRSSLEQKNQKLQEIADNTISENEFNTKVGKSYNRHLIPRRKELFNIINDFILKLTNYPDRKTLAIDTDKFYEGIAGYFKDIDNKLKGMLS